jgi:hypothetical protein
VDLCVQLVSYKLAIAQLLQQVAEILPVFAEYFAQKIDLPDSHGHGQEVLLEDNPVLTRHGA